MRHIPKYIVAADKERQLWYDTCLLRTQKERLYKILLYLCFRLLFFVT